MELMYHENLLDEQGSVTIRSLFPTIPNRTKTAKLLTTQLEEYPEQLDTVLAIAFFPYIEWSMRGEPLIYRRGGEDDESFFSLKKMLSDSFGLNRSLRIERRNAYYALSHPLLDLMEEVLDWIGGHPFTGPTCRHCLECVLGRAQEPIGRYKLSKYLPEAIKSIHAAKGAEIQDVMEPLIGFMESTADIELNGDLFHNVKLLLTKYMELKHQQIDQSSTLSQIMRCKTAAEVIEVTQNLDDVISASNVMQFLITISGAIAMVKTYPSNGREYYEIIKALTGNRYAQPTYGSQKVRILNEEEIGFILGYESKTFFSDRKREAYEVLGLLLWGTDYELFQKIVKN